MALKLPLTSDKTRVGVAAPNAYARINNLEYDTRSGQVEVRVDIYLDQTAREGNKAPIAGHRITGKVGVDLPSLDNALGSGVRSALYAWLKTKKEFLGAVDV